MYALIEIKDGIINEKESEIDRLRRELHAHSFSKVEGEKMF
jgi:hypothetical protein